MKTRKHPLLLLVFLLGVVFLTETTIPKSEARQNSGKKSNAQPHFVGRKLKGRWKLIKRRRGIKVYSMKVKGSPLIAMRGDAVLNAPLPKAVYLLHNVPLKTKWVSRLKKIYTVHTYSPTNLVNYAHYDLPWPVADRDFVYQTRLVIDNKLQQIRWYTLSVSHPKAPKTVGVRGELLYSRYVLKPIDNGRKTFLRAEIQGNPKGSLPIFLVNLIQKQWPYKTIRGIRKALKKSFVKEHLAVKKALQRWQKSKKMGSQNP